MNKTILITGGLGLIGSEMTKKLILNNCTVITIDINEAKTKVKNHHHYRCDLSNEKETKLVLSNILKKHNIDTLVNNAAIDAKFEKKLSSDKNITPELHEFPIEGLKRSFDVNVYGLFLCTQIILNYFIETKTKGNIVNIGSTYSIVSPSPELYFFKDYKDVKSIDYVLSKSFIPNFTRYIAVHYSKYNIRCNTLTPHGVINNASESFIENWKKLSPKETFCPSEQVAFALEYLISEKSNYMTGHNLIIDGGWTAK